MRERYDRSRSKYANEFGQIDHQKVAKEIQQNISYLNTSWMLGIPETELKKMTQDEFILANSKAQKIAEQQREIVASGVYEALIKFANDLFGKKKGK
ncbi:hypothetical protein YK48G_03940 [Lentilactobacillus fungorum]|uniref:Uncharacterized protein n=1 Tax=Lentilactobacillus fungorum TaxID=2201250 RepID=A0ABQ3VZX2_9LACO|nr:hypothetical protein YK48G_03940 [Lentilactobacillus fungorum]